MKINIKATNMELTPAIRDYAEKKLLDIKKLLNTPDGTLLAEIEVAKENHHHKHGEGVFRAEINLQAPGRQFYATANSGDLYVAIDELRDILSGEIKAHSAKRNTRLRRGGRKIKEMIRGTLSWPLKRWRR